MRRNRIGLGAFFLLQALTNQNHVLLSRYQNLFTDRIESRISKNSKMPAEEDKTNWSIAACEQGYWLDRRART
jgi:hypothetical protein